MAEDSKTKMILVIIGFSLFMIDLLGNSTYLIIPTG